MLRQLPSFCQCCSATSSARTPNGLHTHKCINIAQVYGGTILYKVQILLWSTFVVISSFALPFCLLNVKNAEMCLKAPCNSSKFYLVVCSCSVLLFLLLCVCFFSLSPLISCCFKYCCTLLTNRFKFRARKVVIWALWTHTFCMEHVKKNFYLNFKLSSSCLTCAFECVQNGFVDLCDKTISNQKA